MSLHAHMAEARSLLSAAPDALRWFDLLDLLDAAHATDGFDEQLLPYVEQKLVQWPDALRLLPPEVLAFHWPEPKGIVRRLALRLSDSREQGPTLVPRLIELKTRLSRMIYLGVEKESFELFPDFAMSYLPQDAGFVAQLLEALATSPQIKPRILHLLAHLEEGDWAKIIELDALFDDLQILDLRELHVAGPDEPLTMLVGRQELGAARRLHARRGHDLSALTDPSMPTHLLAQLEVLRMAIPTVIDPRQAERFDWSALTALRRLELQCLSQLNAPEQTPTPAIHDLPRLEELALSGYMSADVFQLLWRRGLPPIERLAIHGGTFRQEALLELDREGFLRDRSMASLLHLDLRDSFFDHDPSRANFLGSLPASLQTLLLTDFVDCLSVDDLRRLGRLEDLRALALGLTLHDNDGLKSLDAQLRRWPLERLELGLSGQPRLSAEELNESEELRPLELRALGLNLAHLDASRQRATLEALAVLGWFERLQSFELLIENNDLGDLRAILERSSSLRRLQIVGSAHTFLPDDDLSAVLPARGQLERLELDLGLSLSPASLGAMIALPSLSALRLLRLKALRGSEDTLDLFAALELLSRASFAPELRELVIWRGERAGFRPPITPSRQVERLATILERFPALRRLGLPPEHLPPREDRTLRRRFPRLGYGSFERKEDFHPSFARRWKLEQRWELERDVRHD